jgi:hypothetical protein
VSSRAAMRTGPTNRPHDGRSPETGIRLGRGRLSNGTILGVFVILSGQAVVVSRGTSRRSSVSVLVRSHWLRAGLGKLSGRVRGTRLVVQSLCGLGLVGRGPL